MWSLNNYLNILLAKIFIISIIQVLEDGTYVPPAQKKASYSTMVFVRMAICNDGLEYLKKATCIAIRYSAVRRQVSVTELTLLT